MTDEQGYLQELTKQLDHSILKLQSLDAEDPVDDETHQILKEAVDSEQQLRQNYDIGVRFNILKTQLHTIFDKVEKEIGIHQEEKNKNKNQTKKTLAEDETLVYVSLFNTQGKQLESWLRLLDNKSLYEHSVNRPIYANQNEIEEMLANKPNKEQNGYFIIAIKKNDIMADENTTTLRDPNGFPLLRLKQGAFNSGKIQAFIYRGQAYQIDKAGKLIPKKI